VPQLQTDKCRRFCLFLQCIPECRSGFGSDMNFIPTLTQSQRASAQLDSSDLCLAHRQGRQFRKIEVG